MKKYFCLVLCLLMAFSLIACSQTAAPPAQTEAPQTSGAAVPTAEPTAEPEPTQAPAEPTAEPEPTPYDPYHVEQDLAAADAALQLEYAPAVKTLENGVKVQRTPTDGSGFNTYVLNSDGAAASPAMTTCASWSTACPRGIWISSWLAARR